METKKVVTCGWGIGLALLFSACSTVQPTGVPTPSFVAWSHNGPSEKSVCVLPFTDQTETDGLADRVRQSFAGHFSVKRFADAELHDIDTQLNTGWNARPAKELGQALGCQALVYGTVTRADRLYLGLYSQLALEGRIRFVDALTGQSLLEKTYTTRFHSGGLPLSPLGVVPSAVLNLRNMTNEQMTRAIDDLGRHLANAVPDLPVARSIRHGALSAVPTPNLPTAEEGRRVSPETRPDSYRLQIAAFRSHDEAQQAAQLLRAKGYHPAIAEFTDTEQSWHRVVLGPFPSVSEAQQVGTQIQQSLPFSPIVTRPASR